MSRRCGEALLLVLLIFAVLPALAEPLPSIVVKDGHLETAAGKPFVPLGVNWVIVSPGDVRTEIWAETRTGEVILLRAASREIAGRIPEFESSSKNPARSFYHVLLSLSDDPDGGRFRASSQPMETFPSWTVTA